MKSEQNARHIAIIMDGNGRWAKSQGLSRSEGHRAGAETVERVLEVCGRENIEYLTLYAFSIENWKRPKLEINALMKLLNRFLDKKLDSLISKNIQLNAIGRLDMLPEKVQKNLKAAIERTSSCTGPVLTLALSYGGRAEIVDAAKKLATAVRNGEISLEQIDEDYFSNQLYTSNLPDPDMLVRTSGEVRLSNFLPWQLTYTEFFFTETLWPDFTEEEFTEMITCFRTRERRFGGVLTNA